MNVVAQRGHRIDGIDDVLGEVARVRGSKAHAPDAVNLPHGSEQFREAALAARIAVAVHVLAEQLDLRVAETCDALGLRQLRS